ncbi:MAG: surface-adhesin E family protein [Betaproteobacteria bacterium]
MSIEIRLLAVATFLASLLFCAPNANAEWVRFSENELGDIFFYDTASVKKDSHPIAWILINYQSPVRINKSVIQSSKIMIQIYCKDKSIRELANFEYGGFNGEGKVIRSNESGGAWTPALKQTPEEDMYKILCSG